MRCRALVVDDAEPIRMGMYVFLRKSGLRDEDIAVAGNFEEAMVEAEAFRPNLVFMDMMLPDRDGFEAAMAIYERDPLCRIVVLTSLSREHPKVEALISMGAYDYIKKPVRQSDVQNVVQLIEKEHGSMGRIR